MFEDDRYIRVGGRPLLFIYKPGDLPEPARFVERWQAMATDAGFDGLYLVAGMGESEYPTHAEDGFDAGRVVRVPVRRGRGILGATAPQARGHMRGPKRFPYADVLPEPPDRLRRTGHPVRVPQLGQHAPIGAGRSRGHRRHACSIRRHLRRALDIAVAPCQKPSRS